MDDYIRLNWICPITKQIFLEPVMADDGIIYEKSAIQDWISNNNNTSPMTKAKISGDFKSILMVRNALAAFLEKNPHEKENQYERSNKHADNKHIVEKIFNKGSDYKNLLSFTEFNMASIFRDGGSVDDFCENASFEVQKHFIDNCDDILAKSRSGTPFVYFIFFKSSLEIMKHVLTKNIIYSETDSEGDNVMHVACRNKNLTFEIFTTLIHKTKNIHTKNSTKRTPFDYLCINHRRKIDIIRYYIVNVIEVSEQNKNIAAQLYS